MRWPAAAGMLLANILAGCGVSGEDELRRWMTAQRNQTRPRVTPLTEHKQFVPQAYTQEAGTEPFNLVKLTRAMRQDVVQSATGNASLVAPEFSRRKEALEAYPLEAMTMVGSLRRGGVPVALVRVDTLLHQVRVGNYLGQNYGKVTKIDETEVTLREIVQDGSGDWMARAATLTLQEKAR